MQVDLGPKKRDLGLQHGHTHLDVSALRSAVAAIRPLVAAALQRVLQFERRLLGPNPYSRRLQQQRERGRARRRQFGREDLQKGTAVVRRPVCRLEVAGAAEQVAKLPARKAVLAPLDLRCAAGSSLVFKDRPVALSESTVETAVVSDNDNRVRDERPHGSLVYPMPGDHLVGDAGERFTSDGIGSDGSLKAENVSLTQAMRPSGT